MSWVIPLKAADLQPLGCSIASLRREFEC